MLQGKLIATEFPRYNNFTIDALKNRIPNQIYINCCWRQNAKIICKNNRALQKKSEFFIKNFSALFLY
jgi:hypothetical protein